MRLSSRLLLLGGAAVVVIGCPRPPPPTPRDIEPPAPPILVPPGCTADLSGTYRHAEEATYRYDSVDDGGTWAITVRRELQAADGGLTAPLADLALHRTPDGFRGQTRAEGFAGGVKCPITFPTEVLACEDAGVVLLTAMTAAVDEQCRVGKITRSTPRERQRLVREGADGVGEGGDGDGGTDRDGGSSVGDAGSSVGDGGSSVGDGGSSVGDGGGSVGDGGSRRVGDGKSSRVNDAGSSVRDGGSRS